MIMKVVKSYLRIIRIKSNCSFVGFNFVFSSQQLTCHGLQKKVLVAICIHMIEILHNMIMLPYLFKNQDLTCVSVFALKHNRQ